MKRAIIYLLGFGCSLNSFAQETTSLVYEGAGGCLEYIADEENNYLPDFSYSGYKGGGIALPNVPVALTLNPIEGDNTAAIQFAIDSIATLPLNADGSRGAVQLSAGVFEIHGQLFINQSGIVIRGMGDGIDSTSNTILRGIGNVPNQRDLIIAGNGSINDWKDRVPNSTVHITNPFVPAGSRSIAVESVEKFTKGEEIIVFQPSTAEWLASIDYGATAADEPWSPGQIDIYYQRQISDIIVAENKLLLSAPIYDHLDNALAQSIVYKLEEPSIQSNIGIEQLRIEIETAGELTENHIKNGILLKGIRDSWVQNVTVLHFMYAAVYTRAATNITIRNCQGLLPHSMITGARRYNFDTDAYSNNILFEGCHTSYGRHAYVSNGTSSVSGIVFYNCTSEHDYNASEGHRRWSQGLLFDNITFTQPETTNLLGLYNRGDYGTGHGWAAVNSVAWNVTLSPSSRKILLQKPPGRQNYAIGCLAIVSNEHRFRHPIGKVELTRRKVTPASLYEAQLAHRLANGSRPDAPAKLRVSFQEIAQAYQLDWLDIAADESGYEIQLSTDGGKLFQTIGTTDKNSTSYLYAMPDSLSTNPTFRIAAFNAACKSAFSNPVTLELSVAAHLSDLPKVSIHPNPAKEQLVVEGANDIKAIKIYNMQGILLEQHSKNLKKIAISSLQSGVYFLQIQDKKGQQGIYKFIKI